MVVTLLHAQHDESDALQVSMISNSVHNMRSPVKTCVPSQCMLVAVRYHLIRDGLRSSAKVTHR